VPDDKIAEGLEQPKSRDEVSLHLRLIRSVADFLAQGRFRGIEQVGRGRLGLGMFRTASDGEGIEVGTGKCRKYVVL
jgi:hypothetical protein